MVWIVSVGNPRGDREIFLSQEDITTSFHCQQKLSHLPDSNNTSSADALLDENNKSTDEEEQKLRLECTTEDLMVAGQSTFRETMKSQKWFGLRSTDKQFRQQLDGVSHSDKKQKRNKAKKKAEQEFIPSEDFEKQKRSLLANARKRSESGKENLIKSHSANRNQNPYVSRSISYDYNSVEINNNRRNCKYYSDSTANNSGLQRPHSYYDGITTAVPITDFSNKWLSKSHSNINQNFTHNGRSQSIGDLSSGMAFTIASDHPGKSLQNMSSSINYPAQRYPKQGQQLPRPRSEHLSDFSSMNHHLHPLPASQNQHFATYKVDNCGEKLQYTGDEQEKQRTRRSLPRVPNQNIDEKRQKFTELVKQRILLCSSTSIGQHADTPLDNEVSSLLSSSQLGSSQDSEETDKFKPIECALVTAADARKFRSLQDLSAKEHSYSKSELKHHPDTNGELQQVTATRSHSSTMDSGYSTIDTETEMYTAPVKFKGAQQRFVSVNYIKAREFGSVGCLQNSEDSKRELPPLGILKVRHTDEFLEPSLQRKNGPEPSGKTRSFVKYQKHVSIAPSSTSRNAHSGDQTNLFKNYKESQLKQKYETNIDEEIVQNTESVRTSADCLSSVALFQLLQLYSLYTVEILFSKERPMKESIVLIEGAVDLPLYEFDVDQLAAKSLLKGKYTKLGGPGSAFHPVKSSNSDTCQVTMTSINKTRRPNKHPAALSKVANGDLIIEVNGQMVVDQNTKSVQRLLETTPGSLLLTMARATQAPVNTVHPSNEVLALKEQIKLLSAELGRKDRLIDQLSTMVPHHHRTKVWQSTSGHRRHQTTTTNSNGEIVSISEDEFIV